MSLPSCGIRGAANRPIALCAFVPRGGRGGGSEREREKERGGWGLGGDCFRVYRELGPFSVPRFEPFFQIEPEMSAVPDKTSRNATLHIPRGQWPQPILCFMCRKFDPFIEFEPDLNPFLRIATGM